MHGLTAATFLRSSAPLPPAPCTWRANLLVSGLERIQPCPPELHLKVSCSDSKLQSSALAFLPVRWEFRLPPSKGIQKSAGFPLCRSHPPRHLPLVQVPLISLGWLMDSRRASRGLLDSEKDRSRSQCWAEEMGHSTSGGLAPGRTGAHGHECRNTQSTRT